MIAKSNHLPVYTGNLIPILLISLFFCAGNSAIMAQGLSSTSASSSPHISPSALTRLEFSRKIARITPGMTPEQVEGILGKPDRVATFSKSESVGWFYGCEGPNDLPTLGRVAFDNTSKEEGQPKSLRVDRAFGGRGVPPSPQIISEKELRRALLLLDDAPDILGSNPATLVQIVNGLLPLGKTKILAAVAEYDRAAVNAGARFEESDEWRPDPSIEHPHFQWKLGSTHLLPVLSALFYEPPQPAGPPKHNSEGPQVGVGQFLPPTLPVEPGRLPILLVDDIPLLPLGGIVLGGQPSSAADAVPYYQKHGKLRQKPLVPSGRIEEVLAHAEASPLLNHLSEEQRKDLRRVLRVQLLRMLTPLYPAIQTWSQMSPPPHLDFYSVINEGAWYDVTADLKIHPIRWNVEQSNYKH